MNRFFELERHGTSVRREATAALATFLTMAYIVVVNPAVLEAAGLPRGASTTATILTAALGTLLMGFYARRPFAIAPYMGENAFIAVTVVQGMGFPWPTALGAIFIAGVAFTLLTVFRVRGWLASAIPASLKHSFAVGIGLFLAFIGLNETGIVVAGGPGHPVALGAIEPARPAPRRLRLPAHCVAARAARARRAPRRHPHDHGALDARRARRRCRGSGSRRPPASHRCSASSTCSAALSPRALPVVLVVFVMAFVDTIGTLSASRRGPASSTSGATSRTSRGR